MTREEFIENVNDFYDLLEVCRDNDLYACADIREKDELFDSCNIDNEIIEAVRSYSWHSIRDMLDGLDDDGNYYIVNGILDYECVDRDFEYYKNGVIDEMDEDNLWEEEDGEDETDDGDDFICETEVERFYHRIEDKSETFETTELELLIS